MKPVVAIGIDAADPLLVDRMMRRGQLSTLSRLRRSGGYGQVKNLPFCRAETAWTMFLTGVHPERTAYWSPLKYRQGYLVDNVGAYDFLQFPPFYAQLPEARIAAVDLPQTRLVAGMNGVQVVGWGSHSPLAPSGSEPAGLLSELVARHGSHPAFESDEASIFDRAALLDLRDRLVEGLRRRSAMTVDVLRRERWDLFLTMISETHAAGHYLWHLSDPDHPLYPSLHRDGEDPVADVMCATDRTLGDIIDAAPPDATIVVFSGHGMEANSMDLPSMVFLPELLFRHSFPGRRGLGGVADDAPLPPVQARLRRSCWEDDLYALKHDDNPVTRFLRQHVPGDLHYRVERKLGRDMVPVCYRECSTLHYQPAWWYQKAWPEMQAFALPSFSEGYIRVNLAGREPRGIVQPAAYDRVCSELTTLVSRLRDARTGRGLVRQVRRTRRSPDENAPSLPDPDLIVSWESAAADVVESSYGRIGPVPFLRTGSHVERGFVLISGPDTSRATALSTCHSLDLPPTILALMGAEIPATLEGRPLVPPSKRVVPTA